MKHEAYMDKTDRAELSRALRMIETGRKLRDRIVSRIGMRAMRDKEPQ